MQSSVKRKERKRAVFIPYYSEKKTYAMAFSELLIRPSLQYRFKWKTLAITPSLKQCIPFFLLYGSGKKGSESSSSKSAYKRAYRGGTQFGCTVNWSIRPR
jgi:hypothetical protein